MSEKWYVVLKKLLKPWTKTLNNFVQYLIILSRQNNNKRQAPLPLGFTTQLKPMLASRVT